MPMNKKSQIIEIFGILVILGITIFGAFNIYTQKDNLYVGIKGTYIAYNYIECKEFLNNWTNEQITVFTSLDDASNNNYQISGCK